MPLEIGDVEPAWSLIHLRAEITKSRGARTVAFERTLAQLLLAYLRQRAESFGKIDARLFLSMSRRNRGARRQTTAGCRGCTTPRPATVDDATRRRGVV